MSNGIKMTARRNDQLPEKYQIPISYSIEDKKNIFILCK